MSADGYFRIPRKLLLSSLTMERQYALAWLVSQASYAEREVGGVPLNIGETPPISLTMLEDRFRWTRKAARVFLDYALSPKCAEETGIRLRLGKKVSGHTEGHSEGHRLGHTYVVGLVRFADASGHTEGHSEGHRLGHTVKKTEENTGKNTPPTGESRGGLSENGTAPRKRAVPRPLPDDWQPNERHQMACDEAGIDNSALAEDFRFYWRETNGTKANWDMTYMKRIAAVRSTGKFRLNGNGRAPVTGQTSVPDDAVAAAILARMQG